MPKFFTYFLLFLNFFCFSQEVIHSTVIDSVHFEANQFIGTDAYKNYYFIKKNTLVKVGNNKNTSYQNLTLGKLTFVDIQNPLQIVLFYKDFNTIVLLDNQLNETTQVNGNNFGLIWENVGLSRQNSLWFFDSISMKFGLFNLIENKFQLISNPLNEKIKLTRSSYNNFYWLNEENELFSINYFGKINSYEKIPDAENYEIISQNDYLYMKNQKIFYFSNNKTYEIVVDKNTFSNFCYKDGILSIFTNNFVINYKIKLP